MEYRKFEKLSWKPSLLGMGCMRLPLKADGHIDEVETATLFKVAFEGGVTYFDTAYPYHGGESELVVGRILKNYPRKSFSLTTKLPIWKIKEESDILKIFNEQLKKLQVDYFDVYLLHAIDKARYDFIKSLNVFDILTKLKKEGKIKHIGFSFHGKLEDFTYILNDGLPYFEICQIQLNYMDINHQQGLTGYHLLVEHKIPIIIMEPVKGGSLSHLPSEIEAPLLAYRPNHSISSWAFRWLMQFKGLATMLSGMSNLEQVQDNLKTFNESLYLNDEENKLIEEVREKLKTRIYVPCTGCEYCLPCPMGVEIKSVFAKFNEMYMYDRYQANDKGTLINEYHLNNCIACGVCLSKCPQSIKIPELLNIIKLKVN
jgi:predicted aldo/keto reductase-like oxidoreductase